MGQALNSYGSIGQFNNHFYMNSQTFEQGDIFMLQAILEMFTTEQKAAAMLAHPIIEFIFMTLFIMFALTLFVHLVIFMKLKHVRNHLRTTGKMDIEPLRSYQEQFQTEQQTESINVETFVQERFSSWKLFNLPIVNLIKMVQMTISIFILLGVLGTFIGLTISLGSINAGSDQLVENVASVLSGIDVAFYTSIIGMSFSLMMTILARLFNTEYMLTDIMLMCESSLNADEERGLSRLITVSETINDSILKLQTTHEESLQGIVDAFSGFKDYTEGLQQSAEDLKAFNDGLAHNLTDFQTLFQDMKQVTDGFSKGTTALNDNFKTLFSHIKQSEQKNNRIVSAIERVDEHIESVSDEQLKHLDTFTGVVEDIKTFSQTLLDDQATIQQTLEKNTDENRAIAQTMGTHNETFKTIFGQDLSAELKSIGIYLKELTGEFDKVGRSITTLPQALDVINETQAEYKHLLSDRFEELKDFNQSFSRHLKDHANESATFEQQMRDAATTYEQMARTHQQLMTEMNTTLTQVDRVSSKQDQHLEANVNHLKDILEKYITNFEGTMGSRMEQVVRQIGDSMEMTSDDIKREFMDIRRINEDIHQHYSRSMQQLLQDVGREIQTLNRNLTTVQQPVTAQNRIGWNQHDR